MVLTAIITLNNSNIIRVLVFLPDNLTIILPCRTDNELGSGARIFFMRMRVLNQPANIQRLPTFIYFTGIIRKESLPWIVACFSRIGRLDLLTTDQKNKWKPKRILIFDEQLSASSAAKQMVFDKCRISSKENGSESCLQDGDMAESSANM